MVKQPEYPVFGQAPKPASNAPPPSSLPGLKWLLILATIAAPIAALFVIAPMVKDCNESKDREAAENQQRRDREDAKACDGWGGEATSARCAAYRERKQSAAVNAPVTCDAAGPRERHAWLDRPNSLRKDRATPRALGFSDDGDKCALRLVTRALDCSKDPLRGVLGDDPYLREAKEEGFQWLVCDSRTGRSTYPLSEIVQR